MRCSVDLCENNQRSGRRKPGVSFHYFPMCREMSIKWIEALGWRNRHINSHHRICSEHFEERFLDRSLGFKTRLTKDAVPTLFEPNDHHQVQEEPAEEVLELAEEDIVIEYTEDHEETPTDFEEAYRKQSLLVEGLYQELQTNESETNSLRDELEVLRMKYKKLQKLLQHMTPFERRVIGHELHPDGKNDEICQFASNLYNISPLAYDFVQKSLLTALPDVETYIETEEI